MKGLLRKEFLSLKSTIKVYLFNLIIFSIIGIVSKNVMYITMIISITSINQTFTSFNYDYINQWDKFALTLPIKRKDVVISKYIYSNILIILSLVFSFIISFFGIYMNGYIDLIELVAVNYSVFFIIILLNNVIIPISFKFGVEKARISLFTIFILFALAIFSLKFVFSEYIITSFLLKNKLLILTLSPLFLIMSIFISCIISIKIYNIKDF